MNVTLQWRHIGHNGFSNHQPHDCLLNCLFRRRSKKISKLRVTGLFAGNSPGTAQMASNAENVSIWWRHHDLCKYDTLTTAASSVGWRVHLSRLFWFIDRNTQQIFPVIFKTSYLVLYDLLWNTKSFSSNTLLTPWRTSTPWWWEWKKIWDVIQ